MITLNTLGNGKRYEKSGYHVVCSFHIFLKKSSEKNSTDVLASSGNFIDFYKKKEANCITSPYDDLQFFRSVVMKKRSTIFNENDRLSYIDNDNDEIPIDQQTEFLEALKFAQEYYKNTGQRVPLIITKAKDKSVKSSQKVEKTELSNNSGDKMPPMRVESTPLQDLLTSDTPEGAAAVNEFKDFLESYKKQIIAEVTDQVYKKMTMAMLLSQNVASVGTLYPIPSQSFPQVIPKESQKSKNFTDAESKNSGKGPDDPEQFKTRTGNFMQSLIKPQFPEKTLFDLIKEKVQKKEGSYEKNIANTSENAVIGPKVEKVSGNGSSHVPHLLKDLRESTKEKNISEPSGNTVIGPQLEKCSKCVANQKISDDIYYLAENLREDAKEKLMSGKSNICLPHRLELAKARRIIEKPLADENNPSKNLREDAKENLMAGTSNICPPPRLELGKAMRSIKKQLADGNNPSSDAEKAGPSGKSGNNDDNQDVNEKQSPSDSDNISILSDHSHMSDFMTGYDDNEDKLITDFNKILLRPENQSDESSQSEEVEKPRRESSSSFEMICESPSWMEDKEQPFFLGKKSQKSLKDLFFIEPETSMASPKDNIISSAFDTDTREKSCEKNIAETSEDTVIAPQLEKRSGGAYSYVPYILEESRENVFDVSSSKSAKSADKKFKMFRSDEEPRGVVFFGKKKTAEQQKSPEDRETLQPRRRVVFDHNTAKGLGDTKQTSPKKRGVNKSGESRRPTFFDPGSSAFQHHYGYVAAPRYFCPPPQFPDGSSGNHENWSYFYGGQVPPQMNQPQWPPGYPPYPDTMHILPETLISGAVQAASSAYTTARKVIEKIRSPPPDSPRGPQPPKM